LYSFLRDDMALAWRTAKKPTLTPV
jgi:hypothetical protein